MPAKVVKIQGPKRSLAVQAYVVEVFRGLGITLRHFFVNIGPRVEWLTLAALLFAVGCLGGVGFSALWMITGGYANSGMFFLIFMGLPCAGALLFLLIGLYKKWRPSEGRGYVTTVQYPEETVEYPKRFRGVHRLMTRDDGSVRCVACMCCATVCPANCIDITAGDVRLVSREEDPRVPTDPRVEKYAREFTIDMLRCIFCGLCVEACPCDAIRMDTGIHMPSHDARSDFIYDRETLLEHTGISIAQDGGAAGWRGLPKPDFD